MLSTQDIINVINLFKQNGSAVLLITHREEIALIADRASQICRNAVVCSGSPREVAEYYKSRQFFAVTSVPLAFLGGMMTLLRQKSPALPKEMQKVREDTWTVWR